MPESLEHAPHTHRVTLLIAAVGVMLAGYALYRIDNTRDREDATRDRVAQLESAQAALRGELAANADRDTKARAELDKEWQQLAQLPQEVKDLAAAHEDLRARTERPQRAWSRAEALYLIELAQRRLSFDHDTVTAITALESADQRLASLRDNAFNAVRERIAKDLRALRAVPEPDRTGIVTRLLAIETQADRLPLKGILAGQRSDSADTPESASVFSRAYGFVAGALGRMFTVRRIDAEHGSVVSLEEQAVRKQHLALLLFAARNAAIRGDQAAYRTALVDATAWLKQYFDESPLTGGVVREMVALNEINVAPPLPDISATAQMLARATGVQATP